MVEWGVGSDVAIVDGVFDGFDVECLAEDAVDVFTRVAFGAAGAGLFDAEAFEKKGSPGCEEFCDALEIRRMVPYVEAMKASSIEDVVELFVERGGQDVIH